MDLLNQANMKMAYIPWNSLMYQLVSRIIRFWMIKFVTYDNYIFYFSNMWCILLDVNVEKKLTLTMHTKQIYN